MNARRGNRLGQHFLRSRSAAEALVEVARRAEPHEVVAEVGTGTGFLTRELLKGTRALLVSAELDPRLCGRMASSGGWRLEVVCGDALSLFRRFDYLVASLPYYESSRFVEWLPTKAFMAAAVILQAEFARKLTARPGDEGYGAVSAFSSIALRIELGTGIGAAAFRPMPKVSSQVVFMRPRALMSPKEARWMISHLRKLFSYRGKMARSACRNNGIACDCGERRVEELAPGEALAIAAAIPT